MVAKEKINKKYFFVLIEIFILLFLIVFYIQKIPNKEAYAVQSDKTEEKNIIEVRISQAKRIDIDDILKEELTKKQGRIEIYEKNEELEYMTKYINNSELYIGTTKVSQEGINGIQTITFKKIFDNNGDLISEEQVNCRVTKSSIDKIIEVGSKKNDRNSKRY